LSEALVTPPEGDGPGETVASRLAFYQRAGGVLTPLVTTIFAFFVGGLVVLLITHKNPLSTYKAIFNGTGLNWFFPWISHADRINAAYNLQSTLLLTTPLILTGLAVAFAFRAGLFNIGGQGQYAAGSIVGVWVASSLTGVSGFPHIVLAIVLGSLAGAALAGIAGFLRATVGAHEVITTIMLNWTVFWLAGWLFGQRGPLQTSRERSLTQSNDIAPNTHLHVWWGNPILQGLHVGFFIALAMLVVYWVILNRTTLGYEIRAVGYNPEAASYAGINVRRAYFLAMAISGAFAGLAGVIDVLGWKFVLSVDDVQGQAGAGAVGFLGIAVALLGRNSAVGIFFAALLFGALLNGTSDRHLDPSVFPPTLAENLTLLIQGLVLLFIGADILVIYLWRARRKVVPRKLLRSSST
jgi:general nucleoside transport system permease protein